MGLIINNLSIEQSLETFANAYYFETIASAILGAVALIWFMTKM